MRRRASTSSRNQLPTRSHIGSALFQRVAHRHGSRTGRSSSPLLVETGGSSLRRAGAGAIAVAAIVTLLAGAPLAATTHLRMSPAGDSLLLTTTTITGTTASPVVGQAITVDVSVGADSGTPTGTVTVSDGETQTCVATLVGGAGSCSITETVAGSYSFTASYGGDDNFAGSVTSSSTPVTVGQDATTTAITGATSSFVIDEPITLNVSVAANSPGSGTPTGNVTVSDGTQTCPVTLAGGVGSCQITETVAGSYSFTASYGGDPNYATSDTSSGFELTVGGDSTTTTITGTTPTSPVVGQPITLDVSVGADSGTPTGTATVSDGTQTCLVTLADGAGSCQITETTADSFSFTATYSGDTNFASSATSAGSSVRVGEGATTTGVTSPTTNPVVGQPITLDVTVGANSPGSGTPTGGVTVSDGGTQSCPVTLVDGTGSCQITETAAGPYGFTATYTTDGNFLGSFNSTPLGVSVGADATTTGVTSPTTNPVVGQPITLDVTVGANSPGSGTPTGGVTVSDGGTQSCPVTLVDGTGSCQITETAAGPYGFTATYTTDGNFLGSFNSTPLGVSVGAAGTSTAITSMTSSFVVGQPVVVNVSVVANDPGSGTPTGTVTVSDGTRSCLAGLSGGVGSCHISETAAGRYIFTASYPGTSNFASSVTSSGFDVTVGGDSTTTHITSTTPSPVVGQPITVNVGVGANAPGSGTPTGSVTVSDGTRSCLADLSGGAASCHITETAAGPYSLVATYTGNSNDASSVTSPGADIVVGQDPTATVVTSTTPGPVVGQPITVRVKVAADAPGGGTPTGAVSVSDGTRSCVAQLSGGAGSCHVTETATGRYNFDAIYTGSSNFDASGTSVETVVNVAKATSRTVFKLSASKVTYGAEQAEHLSVTVSPEFAGTPSGKVTVKAGNTTVCVVTLSAAKGSCAPSATRLGPGEYHLSVTYGGNSEFDSSAPALQNFTVAKATSSTAFKMSSFRVTYGAEQAEHVSVTVSPEFAGTPTGTITVEAGDTTLCVVTLSSAKGSCALSATRLSPGSHQLSVTYGGNSAFDSSAPALQTLTVARATSSTAFKVSSFRVTYGHEQAENLSVTVSPEFAGTPTGTITVQAGTSTLCKITLSSAKGSCELSATGFGPGSYNLAANYGGDPNFAPSSDAVGTAVTVVKASSSTVLRLSTAKVIYGHEQAERLSVTVTPEFAGTPTGHVAVKRGKTTLCEITLSSDKGSCTLAPTRLGPGTYDLGASYGGDGNFGVSGDSAGTAVLVSKATSSTALKLSASRVTYGHEQDERLSVKVSPEFRGTPSGSIRVKMGATTLCEITLSSGKGSCTLAPTKLGAGTYHLGATYEGSSDFRGSLSALETLTIPFGT